MKNTIQKIRKISEIPKFYAINEDFGPFSNVAISSSLKCVPSKNFYILHQNLKNKDRKFVQ